MGILEPIMPSKKSEGESVISTMEMRASKREEMLRPKCGHVDAPGMMSRSCAIIWQPLQTPREKVSGREELGEHVEQAGVEENGFCPAAACAEDVAVGEAAAGCEAGEVGERDAAGEEVAHVDVDCGEGGAVEGCGHFYLAVDALLAEDGDAGALLVEERGGDFF